MENKTAVSVVSSTTGLTLGQIPKHRSVLIGAIGSGAVGLTLSFMTNTGSPSNQFNTQVASNGVATLDLPLRITGLTASGGSVSVAFLT